MSDQAIELQHRAAHGCPSGHPNRTCTLARSLIEALGGRLWVEGGDGAAECGASFHFTLPTATPAEEGP